MIIQFGGYATSGKDTAGAILGELGFVHEAFANPLKKMALAINPLIPVDTTLEKEGFTPNKSYNEDFLSYVKYIRLADLVEQVGWAEAKKNPEVRRYLQATGTEGVRDCLGEDTWKNALLERVAKMGFKNTYITDTRFPNEILEDYDLSVPTFFFWIHRPGVEPARGHVSEQDLSSRADQILFNTGSIAQLQEQVVWVLNTKLGLSLPEKGGQ